MTTQNFASVETLESLPVVAADWAAMTPAAQRDYFSQNGFLVVPGAVEADAVRLLLSQLASLGSHARLERELWDIDGFVPLVDNPRVLAAVRNIVGKDIRFFNVAYTATPPGQDGQRLHVDQNTHAYPGDFRNTAASWINVGIYLTDLSVAHAPLWVVPGSNRRYDLLPNVDQEQWRSQARMVLARAGDAVLFHRSTLHAAGANRSTQARHGVFLSYRPAWAKPIGQVSEWPLQFVNKLKPSSRKLMLGLNDGGC